MRDSSGRGEILYVLVTGAGLALLTALPYALGAILSTPEMQFSGFIIGQEDGYSYACKSLQGYQGDWLFHICYTPEPHEGRLFFLFYILLGKLARFLGLSLPVALHISRVIFIPIAVYAFYQLVSFFTSNSTMRRLAVAFIAFGAGLGWLWVFLGLPAELGEMPVDLWVPDASFFLSALTFPHLVLAQAFLFWFVLFTLRFVESGDWRDGLRAALVGLGSSLIHPYTLPVMSVPLGIYALWLIGSSRQAWGRTILRLAIAFVPSFPYLIYAWLVFQNDFVFIAWQKQSLVYSPPVHLYVLGFGIPLFLAVLELIVPKERASRHPFLLIWLLVIPPLLYVPDPAQRRFLDGYQAPVAILAAGGLYYLYTLLRRPKWRIMVTAVLFVPVILTNVFLLFGSVMSVTGQDEPIYRPGWEIAAANWFQDESGYPVVLSSYATGNMLPAHAPVRSFAGHGPETVDSANKVRMVKQFFASGNNDAWRRELLEEYGVDYVYYGPRERALGGFEPAQASYLRLVYDNEEVEVYEVE